MAEKKEKKAPRGSSGLYHNTNPEKQEMVSKIVSDGLDNLISSTDRKPCKYTDFDEIKIRTEQYIKGCAEIGRMPTVQGLLLALGVSRYTLYKWFQHHPEADAVRYLELVRAAFADMLEQGAMDNSINNISAIFLLKAQHSYVEQSQINFVPEPVATPLGDKMSMQEIEAAVIDMIE